MSFRAIIAERNSDKFSKKMLKGNFQWRQNLTRPYKSISSQKMSPRKSECKTVISLQNLLLSQTILQCFSIKIKFIECNHQ